MIQSCLAAIWQLIRSPGLVEARGLGLLIFLLFVLETFQYPSGIGLEEVTLSVRVDGEHPSSCHVRSRLHFPYVREIQNLVVNPGLKKIRVFCSSKLLAVSLYFLS